MSAEIAEVPSVTPTNTQPEQPAIDPAKVAEDKEKEAARLAAWHDEVKAIRGELCRLEEREAGLSETLKGVRKEIEAKLDELKAAIDNDGELTLFDGVEKGGADDGAKKEPVPAEDESWKSVTLEQLGITKPGVVAILTEKELTTMGAIAEYTNAGKRLIDIKGIGDAAVQMIEDAMAEYWVNNPRQTPTAAVGQKVKGGDKARVEVDPSLDQQAILDAKRDAADDEAADDRDLVHDLLNNDTIPDVPAADASSEQDLAADTAEPRPLTVSPDEIGLTVQEIIDAYDEKAVTTTRRRKPPLQILVVVDRKGRIEAGEYIVAAKLGDGQYKLVPVFDDAAWKSYLKNNEPAGTSAGWIVVDKKRPAHNPMTAAGDESALIVTVGGEVAAPERGEGGEDKPIEAQGEQQILTVQDFGLEPGQIAALSTQKILAYASCDADLPVHKLSDAHVIQINSERGSEPYVVTPSFIGVDVYALRPLIRQGAGQPQPGDPYAGRLVEFEGTVFAIGAVADCLFVKD